MKRSDRDYRWLNWLSWGVGLAAAAMVVWSFVTYGEINFSAVHWVIIGVLVVAELAIWFAKKKLQGDD